MRRKPFDDDDGMRVWLSRDEIRKVEETVSGTEKRIAVMVGARCGLRRGEAVDVRPQNVVNGPGGKWLRVPEGKWDKYRETPIDEQTAALIEAVGDFGDDGEPVIGHTPRTINRWVKRAGETLHADTGDIGWLDLTYHDLRRSWGTGCLEQGVLPTVVMEWGGWEDWETFREHYLGEFSPEALKRERKKIEGDGLDVSNAETHLTPVSPGVRGGQ